jgi:hypothetical protein
MYHHVFERWFTLRACDFTIQRRSNPVLCLGGFQ